MWTWPDRWVCWEAVYGRRENGALVSECAVRKIEKSKWKYLVVREVRMGARRLFSCPSPDVALLPAVTTNVLVTCSRKSPATTEDSMSLGTKATPFARNTLLVATRSGTCRHCKTEWRGQLQATYMSLLLTHLNIPAGMAHSKTPCPISPPLELL